MLLLLLYLQGQDMMFGLEIKGAQDIVEDILISTPIVVIGKPDRNFSTLDGRNLVTLMHQHKLITHLIRPEEQL